MKKTLITTSLIAALFAVPAMATQEETDQKTVTSKYYVDQELATKQDTITTGLVDYTEPEDTIDYDLPALVSYDSTSGLTGNKIGVLGYGQGGLNIGYAELGNLDDDAETAYLDNLVPTVRAVANEFSLTYDEINAIIGDITTINTTIETKQNEIDAGTAGNVVTYTGTAGQVGSANVASDALYSNNTLYNGSDVANIAAVETKQDKMTCAGYLAGHENDEDYCWLYSVAETRTTCTAANQTCDPNNNTCCSGICMPGKTGNYTCKQPTPIP